MNTALIMALPVWPIWIVDLLGSALMILFSFLCVRLARRLRQHDNTNVVWTYLLWVCYALASFAMSRSVGHIAKRVLLSTGYPEVWSFLQPYSGAINSLMFVVVAAITLFFERVWNIYQQILGDKQALQEAHTNLLFLNHNLENLVAARTLELSLSERKYRRIFEASQDMILVATPLGLVMDLNPAGVRLLGLDGAPDQTRAFTFQDFLQDAEEWRTLESVFQKQGYVANREVRLKRLDGVVLNALLSGTATRDEASGTMESIHFLVKDISQHKAMERQLLQADKLASIGQLAAGIAHEINNPMGMVLGYTQLLLRGEQPGSERHQDLKIIEKHARTCKSIVSDLLSFARSTPTRKEPSRLHAAIEEVIQVIHHHMKMDRVQIQCDFDQRVPVLVMDAERIKQVLMNLLMNAKHAIREQGTIRVSTSYDDTARQVKLSVADDGCGIEPQNLSRVFDPFFTTKDTGEGTGLGLSVSYGIVQDHGGNILVTSELGKGSIFTVFLPTNGGLTDATP
jgi:two-component system NtrC family sensor kinase